MFINYLGEEILFRFSSLNSLLLFDEDNFELKNLKWSAFLRIANENELRLSNFMTTSNESEYLFYSQIILTQVNCNSHNSNNVTFIKTFLNILTQEIIHFSC